MNVLTRLAIILYEQPTIKNLDEVKKTYQKQMNEQATHDRLTWRLELLKKAISWRVEDEEFENFVQYIVKLQAKKDCYHRERLRKCSCRFALSKFT